MLGKRGALIVLEGCDRAGKSTQVKLLMNALNELRIPAKHQAFPSKLHACARLSRLRGKHFLLTSNDNRENCKSLRVKYDRRRYIYSDMIFVMIIIASLLFVATYKCTSSKDLGALLKNRWFIIYKIMTNDNCNEYKNMRDALWMHLRLLKAK